MSRTNTRGSGGDKGTYGRIASKEQGKNKQPRRSSNGSAKAKSASSGKNNGKPSSSSSSYSKKKKAPGVYNNYGDRKTVPKAVPKSKHHTPKPHRDSIATRVAAANAAKRNTTQSSYSRPAMGGGGAPPRGAKRSTSYTGGSSSSLKKKKKKNKRNVVRYRMSLSECNDEVYWQLGHVPWFDAEKQERFKDNVTKSYEPNAKVEEDDSDGYDSSAGDECNQKKAGSTWPSSVQLPPEKILQHLDYEIHSFGVYVKLTPAERMARLAFLDHVTDLATDQFSNNNAPSNGYNNGNTANYYADKGRRGSKSPPGGRRSSHGDSGKPFFLGQNGGAASLDDFEEEEEIHVAPFGSFATQDVCTFASDVDMCLWGVVKGAKKPGDNTMEFVGHEGEGSDSDDEECAVVLENTSDGCPLLTESSLLRTMDAIQSAAAQQNTATDSLFFIDRTGEGAASENVNNEDVTNAEAGAEVIDLSTSKATISKGEEAKAKAVTDNKKISSASEEVKEASSRDLKFESVAKSGDGEQPAPSDQQADKASVDKHGIEVGDSPPATELFKPFTMEWSKGCVMSLSGLSTQTCDREAIRESISSLLGVSKDHRVSGLYIDYNRGDSSGYLRLLDEPMPEKFKQLMEHLNDGSTLIADEKVGEARILEGDEETTYWKNLEVFLNERKRKKFDDKGRRIKRTKKERNAHRAQKKKRRKSDESHSDEREGSSAAEKETGEVMLVRGGGGGTAENDEVMATGNGSSPSEEKDLEFVIDTHGVQELGGEVEPPATAAEPTEISVVASSKREPEHKEAGNSKICNDSDGRKQSDTQRGNSFEPGTFSQLGKSAQDAIDINDDSEDEAKNEVIVIGSDDDEDSADKMTSYYSRQQGSTTSATAARSDHAIGVNARASPINLLDDDSSSEASEEFPDDVSQSDQVLELSLTSNNNSLGGHKVAPPQSQPVKPSFGPTGKIRVKVISALQSLTRQLRKSNLTHTIECRSKARVPIINCNTRTGFEGDIAIGGHNGMDTSMYASSQVKRFDSFAPIVLLLKVLMAQQGLDKPFTGGLGSYKLYVLVAYHIECHLASGGTDRPSEILISLLVRYGCVDEHNNNATSDLEQLRNSKKLVASGGGICDLDQMFRLSDCVDMFRECHERLADRVLTADDDRGDCTKISCISSFIDCYQLREARETSDRRAKMCDTVRRSPTSRHDSGKVNAGRRVGKVFSKSASSSGSGKPSNNNNFKRSPRGGIVPKKRPDLKAKHSSRNGREADALQRGTKNRKNNKKQNRDKELRSFALRQSI